MSLIQQVDQNFMCRSILPINQLLQSQPSSLFPEELVTARCSLIKFQAGQLLNNLPELDISRLFLIRKEGEKARC